MSKQGCNIGVIARRKLTRLQAIGQRYKAKRELKLGRPTDKEMLEACMEIGQQLSIGCEVRLREGTVYGDMMLKYFKLK